MSEADQELKPHVHGAKPEAERSPENTQQKKRRFIASLKNRQYKWWIQMIVYSFFVLSGQSVGAILGRLYFNNGGKSQWIATLVQVVGFPVLFPFQFLTTSSENKQARVEDHRAVIKRPFYLNLASIYIALGIFLGAVCMLYSIGLKYLPVTIFALICSSVLAFNSLFSYILNGQRFTPYIVNSIVILTISSVLLVFQSDPGDSNKATKREYFTGFVCALAGSAGYALTLSVTQLAFKKIIKRETLRAIIDMTVYQCTVASIAIVVGIFASGDWRGYGREMEAYKTGKVSYAMNLLWTAVAWQVFSIGCTGLIFKISSLFANVIGILGLPVSPVLAVVFLGDKLTGLKAMSMLLAIWGFVSYMYQHYLDDLEMKKMQQRCVDGGEEEVSEVSLVNTIRV